MTQNATVKFAPRRSIIKRIATWIAVGFCTLATTVSQAQPLEWRQVTSNGPSPRDYQAMAYDSARHVVVLFGGLTSSDILSNETWEWSGQTNSWSQLHPATSPSPRATRDMIYDESRGVCLFFGGSTANGDSGETWEWNGTTWTLRCTCGPSPRTDSAMAYDSNRHVAVLFGGYSTAAPDSEDTWEWDGSGWTLVHPGGGGGPAARHAHAMAYDAIHHVTVLFGGVMGHDGAAESRETWVWNGNAWTVGCGNCGPTARFGHAMAPDGQGAIALFGGHTYAGPLDFGDTWEWNGTDWTQLNSPHSPSPSVFHGMAFDVDRHKTELFGGGANGYVTGQTWELGFPPPEITRQPLSQTVDADTTVILSVRATPSSPVCSNLQWRWEVLDQTTGWQAYEQPAQNCTGDVCELRVLARLPRDGGPYRAIVTDACGGVAISDPALITIRCPADFNNDGGIDGSDVQAFFEHWEAGC